MSGLSEWPRVLWGDVVHVCELGRSLDFLPAALGSASVFMTLEDGWIDGWVFVKSAMYGTEPVIRCRG